MADPTTDFFRDLSGRGSEPMLRGVTATVRFDIVRGEQTDSWLIDIKDGGLDVSNGSGDADCVVTVQQRLFDGIAGGTVNAMAALLRGELSVSGDAELVVVVQRLFPGPPRVHEREASTVEAGRQT